MRVRKNRGETTRFIGKFPSVKLNRIVLWRSQLERDYLYLLEFDPDVLYYQERPFQIDSVDNRLHNHTPDFLVERTNKRQIIDVRPEKNLAGEESAVSYRSLVSICYEKGYEFVIVTDAMIRAQPRLDNIKLLWRYARTPLTTQQQILCYSFMKKTRQASFAVVTQLYETNGMGKEIVYALMYNGMLAFDITQTISSGTALSLPRTTAVARKVS